MWTTEYEATTTASTAAVWDALEALHSGTALGPNSDSFELHGSFAVGTTLTMTPQGQGPVTSTIIELVPGQVYADRTALDGIELVFRHKLVSTPDGGTRVTHTLVIDGLAADQVGPELGPQISDDFPVAMAELLAAAERSEQEKRH